jgi:HemY protein
MIRVLFFVIVLAVLAGLGAWLADTPGEITATVAGYRIESTPAVAVLALAGFTLAVMLIWSVLRSIFKLPALVGGANSRRRQ